jgi:hypothetical protein
MQEIGIVLVPQKQIQQPVDRSRLNRRGTGDLAAQPFEFCTLRFSV